MVLGDLYYSATNPPTRATDWGPFLVVERNRGLRFDDFTDGLSNTLFLGEKHLRSQDFGNVTWDYCIFAGDSAEYIGRLAGPSFPLALSARDNLNYQFGSWHAGVVLFAFGDGHVQSLRNSTPGAVLALLSNRSDGQPVPSFD